MLCGHGTAVLYQLSLLDPPCTGENVVARHEMVPPLLCCLMALVSCASLSILPNQYLVLPKLPCLQGWNGCQAMAENGTTLVARSALSSRAAVLTPVPLALTVQPTGGLGLAKLTHRGSG